MSKSKVDYSELVVALQNGNDRKANQLLEELLPRLVDYLKAAMDADEDAAKDCVYQAFADVYEKIREDKIQNEKYIFKYLIRASRNEYIKYVNWDNRYDRSEDDIDHFVEPAKQYEQLLDEERQQILEQCLDELRTKSRKFISYFFEKPYVSTEQAHKHFKISRANVRTKKTRILKKLHECYKRKSRK